MRAEGLADRTRTEWPRIVLRAAIHAGADPTALTTDQLIDYLADLPSAGTRQTYYTALAAWHRWLCATGRRPDNPLDVLRRPRVPRRSAHPVATAHIDAVLGSGIRRRTRMAILLCALQGLRVHETAKVRGEDVDLLGERFRVVGKGGVEVWHRPCPRRCATNREDSIVTTATSTGTAAELDAIIADLDAASTAWVAAGYGYGTPEDDAREAVFARLHAWNEARARYASTPVRAS